MAEGRTAPPVNQNSMPPVTSTSSMDTSVNQNWTPPVTSTSSISTPINQNWTPPITSASSMDIGTVPTLANSSSQKNDEEEEEWLDCWGPKPGTKEYIEEYEDNGASATKPDETPAIKDEPTSDSGKPMDRVAMLQMMMQRAKQLGLGAGGNGGGGG